MKKMLAAVALLAVPVAYTVHAQQAAPLFKRTVLQQADSAAPGREIITAQVDFQPNGSPGRHTHFGEEVGYLIEGSLRLEQEGKPPVTLNAGQAFIIPAGTIHNATAMGAAKLVATYVVEKGKPLATPAK